MSQISLSYKLKKGRLYLYAYTHYTKERNYLLVDGLKNPDYKSWDEKNQLFVSNSPDAKANNLTLFKFMQFLADLLEHKVFRKGSELFACYETTAKSSKMEKSIELPCQKLAAKYSSLVKKKEKEGKGANFQEKEVVQAK